MAFSRRFPSSLISKVKDVLLERHFTEQQVEKILPTLHEKMIERPEHLVEIIDTWNSVMTRHPSPIEFKPTDGMIAGVGKPPRKSFLAKIDVDMTNILADIEPKLLLLHPDKVVERYNKIESLGIARTNGEHWNILFNAPRGFYLQDWKEILKKVYYIQNNVIDFLHDKKEQKDIITHPIARNAAVIEAEFDHIRTRYLFAHRSGYNALSYMFPVQTALDKPSLNELILSKDKTYLSKFAPFCSIEEYSAFSDLIKNQNIDEDDADIVERLAELNTI